MLGAGKSQQTEQEAGLGVKGDGANTTAAFSFGKYQLFASLGRGGMADVFLAVSRGPMGFNKLVVIKRLRPALAEEEGFRQMFLDEARLAARLNHPNIVHTYEVGEHEGMYFIAMEYLEGQSLNKVMKEAVRRGDQLNPVHCARIVADALSGLHHAHELKDYDGRPLNIIHRDISPHNVFATYDGHVKLVDFGIAKAALSSTETEVGVLKGKVAYMAPEQALGGPIDARADLFAMGIVLWELLTQRRLMTGDSAANTLHRLINALIPRVSSVVPSIDPRLDEIVATALQKDPSRRFQTGTEMRDALDHWIQTTGISAKQDEVGQMIGGMFRRVREEVNRQVQTHMAAVAAAGSTGEFQALSTDSLKRLEPTSPSKLVPLGGSGSGSGVVSSFPPPPTPTAEETQPAIRASLEQRGSMPKQSGPPPEPVPQHVAPYEPIRPEQPRSSGAALFVLAIVLLGGGLITVTVLFRPRARDAPARLTDTPLAMTPAAPPTMEMSPSAEPVAPAPPPTVIVVPLTPETAAPAIPAKRPTSHGTAHSKPQPPAAPSATAAQTDDPGFLTFQTYPFTRVTEGGRSLGTTPLVKVALGPGIHVLTLENSDQGIKQTYTVTIKSGETVVRSLGLK